MFPIRDTLPTLSRPVLTFGLIGANLVIFLILAPQLERAVWELGALSFQYTGMAPADLPSGVAAALAERDIALPGPAGLPELGLRTGAHMFLHGGMLHLLGNLWFLWIFADNVEDRLGKPRFLLLYFLSGVGALAAQVLAAPDSALPMVGASGAISGVLGAYLLLFPQARIVTVVPLGFLPLVFLLSARIFLLYWIGLQLLFGIYTDPLGGGVAWWAHIGGFAAGLLLARPLAPPRRRVRIDVQPRRPPYRSDGMHFAAFLAPLLAATALATTVLSGALPAQEPVREAPRHRPELRLPPLHALEHLHEGNAAHVRARDHREDTVPLPRPAGAGRLLAVVHICADLAVVAPTLLAQAPDSLLVLSAPGPLVRGPEIALVERAATEQSVSLCLILTHEGCPSLSGEPADTPAARILHRKTVASRQLAERKKITTAHAHGHLQRELLLAASETLRRLKGDGELAVAVGVVDDKTHAIRWLQVE